LLFSVNKKISFIGCLKIELGNLTQKSTYILSNIIHNLQQLVNNVSQTTVRQLVVLSGTQAWAFEQLSSVISLSDCLWIGESDVDVGIAMSKAKMVLGRECHQLVFNAYSGFNPDAFGQAVGTLNGGGVCFIISPPLDAWASYDDPDYLRYVASPQQLSDVNPYFLNRIQQLITDDAHAIVIHENEVKSDYECMDLASPAAELATSSQQLTCSHFATLEQKNCVNEIIKVSSGHRNRPLVISADRGRGKSSALGLAAAMLLQDNLTHIIVTAPKVSALGSFFKHAVELLNDSEMHSNTLHWQGKRIEFIAPDELINQLPSCDLLLIDEAAAIPTPMLTVLATKYSRVVFATTIHGYEGTGRGFALRFLNRLKEISPQMRRFELSQPIRWQQNDPLELLSNTLLGLDFKAVNVDSQIEVFDNKLINYQLISQLELIEDEGLLEQVFGLLVLAHYQTSPSDFRQLLDAPNLFIFIAIHDNDVIGVSLVLKEGQLDNELCKEIALGERRLRGHLLPQSLLAQVGIVNAAQYSYGRIMRIAVHPQLQHKNIGSDLDAYVTQWAITQKIDVLGASFGATAELSRYWFNNNYYPARLGFNKDSASGTHSLLVMKALNKNSQIKDIVNVGHKQFFKSFRYDIANHFNQLDEQLVVALLSQNIVTESLCDFDRHNIETFINGSRPFEQVSYIIENVLWNSAGSLMTLSDIEQSIIIQKVLQRKTWNEFAKQLSLTGKKEAQLLLRQAIKALF